MPLLPGRWRRAARRRWLQRQGLEALGRPFFEGMAPRVDVQGTARAGEDLFVRGVVARTKIAVKETGALEIGDHVRIGHGVTLSVSRRIAIGDRCRIGNFVFLSDSNFHEVAPGTGVRSGAVVLGRSGWLGHGVVVLPVVTIGDFSVVAAGSVVTKDVPECSVAAGSPAPVVQSFPRPPAGWYRV